MSRVRTAVRPISVVFLGLVPLLAGCGVQGQLEECQSRLAATEGENSRLEKDLADLRADYREVLRGWGVATSPEESLTEGVLQDVEGRIEQLKTSFAEQVSPMVQEQLEKELGSLVDALDTQFSQLDSRYNKIAAQLGEVRTALDVANQRLQGIEQTGTTIQTELFAQQIDEERLEEKLELLASQIEQFDETRFLCRDCPEFLSLKRKRQDAIIAFHSDLRSALRRLPMEVQRRASLEPDAEDEGEEPGEEEPAAAVSEPGVR